MRKVLVIILALGLLLTDFISVQAETTISITAQTKVTGREVIRITTPKNQFIDYYVEDSENVHLRMEQATFLFFELVDENIVYALVTFTWHETDETLTLYLLENGYLLEGVAYGGLSFNAPGLFTLSSWVKFCSDPDVMHLNMHIEVIYRYELVSPSTHTFLLNGEQIDIHAFNIHGYNFLRICDLANALWGTDSRFDVFMEPLSDTATVQTPPFVYHEGFEYKIANPIVSQVIFNDADVFADIMAYLIGDIQYLKLRNLADMLSFEVEWDEESMTVFINA